MKLVTDSAWNFLSLVIPAVVALPVFAWIARLVGIELFGIFTLSFAIAGYASIFDLGLSRALIREVAINKDKPNVVRIFINTATVLIFILSAVASLAVFFSSHWIVDFINVSPVYRGDAINGIQLLALCLPPMLITQVWLSYFEGLEQFAHLSYFKVFSSLSTVLLPLALAVYYPSFTMLVLGLVIARFLTFTASALWLTKYIEIKPALNWGYATQLFKFGSWLTVSSVIGPVMVYFDRFILSSMIGAKRVAFYTAPSELVLRLITLPSAVSRTLFPNFSANTTVDNQKVYKLSVIILGLSATLIALPIFIFAENILILWMGAEFTGEPKWVLRILVVGFVFNAMAQVPFTQLQAKGFSKVTALVHCAEVLPYLIILYLLIDTYGVIGAALAWLIRVIFDTIALFFFNKLKIENKNE